MKVALGSGAIAFVGAVVACSSHDHPTPPPPPAATHEVHDAGATAAPASPAVPTAWRDRLAPVDQVRGGLAEYEAQLATVFARAFTADVVARALYMPSFAREWVVGLRRRGEVELEAFVLRPSVQVWQLQSAASFRRGQETYVGRGAQKAKREREAAIAALPRLDQIRVTEQVALLDDDLGRTCLAALRVMVDAVRPREPPPAPDGGIQLEELGFDGETTDFMATRPDGSRHQARTWSPEPDTRPHALTQMGVALAQWVEAAPSAREPLRARIVELAHRAAGLAPPPATPARH